jgi:glycerophosphoryl diester phosphodiesterase
VRDPLYIDRDGHRTWIKWHRGKRRASDPVFTGARIVEAMRLGASVEVDLVIHGDHGCAILHDHTLDRETTGTGLVRAASADAIRQLHLRDNDGRPLPDRVMLLEDLCDLLAQEPPHPDALLQLDIKEDQAAFDPRTVENVCRSIKPLAANIIASGADVGAISLLTNSTPKLTKGYDPCYGDSLARLQADGDFSRFIAEALKASPDASFIYLNYEIVLAADRAGFDMIDAVHTDGRRVDAWTIREINDLTLPSVQRLVALRADQITTDDPEGLLAALAP